jgi:Trk K+ transport system NAD-binding subunit
LSLRELQVFLVVGMLAGLGRRRDDVRLPRLLVLIDRQGVSIVPSGTVVQEGDKLVVLTGPNEVSAVRSLFTA